jgi:capsular polysaccharide transport system permease protein
MQKRPPLTIMRSVVFALVLREMRTRFGKRRMGAFWVLFEPLAHVLVLLLMFSYMRGRSMTGVDFPVFLLTGVVPFFIFKSIALRIMEGVEANRGLFAYRQIKPVDTFIARVLVEVSIYATVYVLTLAGMGWYGLDIGIHAPLEWFLLLATLIVFGFGLGNLLCIAGYYLPEAKIFINLLFFPLYLLSGIIFPVSSLPPAVLPWLLWNPILHFMELIRHSIFAYYPMVDGVSFTYAGSWALVSLFLGLWLYRYRRLELVAQ